MYEINSYVRVRLSEESYVNIFNNKNNKHTHPKNEERESINVVFIITTIDTRNSSLSIPLCHHHVHGYVT